MARILIVDDKASNRELLRTILEHSGHAVTEACDGLAGLELMRSEKPDLTLLDIQMPGLDGYAVLERVMADNELREIPVIALTAYAMQGDHARGTKAGFRDYITKPVSMRQLIAAVDQQLKRD